MQPLLLALVALQGAPDPAATDRWIETHHDELTRVNRAIWAAAEVGLEERESSETLARWLEQNGFRVTRGVAGMPTAFVAEIGSGAPRIGILAEYDALPGVSQVAEPERKERAGAAAGHACGHSLFGTASTAAAIAAAQAARAAGLGGTVRLYGTPAEETGIGKLYMARAGLFDDLDVALHWHPADTTETAFASSKAVVSIKARFSGKSAHASRSPAEGRSALDAVELMDVGANFYREHVPEDARIHYVITDGGGQPNVVPASAEVWYYLRADSHATVEGMLARLRDIARGAALMTGTSWTERIDSDVWEILPNRPLSEVLQRHLERVGPPVFTDEERAFALRTQSDFTTRPDEPLASAIQPLAAEPFREPASSDVGNVSWTVPTAGLRVACYSKGAPGHSWQVVACSGTTLGEKGLVVAARALASATLELLARPDEISAARVDFERRRAATPRPSSVLPADQHAPATIR